MSKTARIVVGVVLSGGTLVGTVLSVGAPALASHSTNRGSAVHAQHSATHAARSTGSIGATGTVAIGTAATWTRTPNGGIVVTGTR